MVYFSIVCLVTGVFILPILGVINLSMSVYLFGLALIIFALSPIVLAGHYNLYLPRSESSRPHVTTQEKWAFLVSFLLTTLYLIAIVRVLYITKT